MALIAAYVGGERGQSGNKLVSISAAKELSGHSQECEVCSGATLPSGSPERVTFALQISHPASSQLSCLYFSIFPSSIFRNCCPVTEHRKEPKRKPLASMELTFKL